jgi:dTDP-4-dehydrorhamnose reductase
MSRLLILGSKGFLGGWLMHSRDARFEMIGADRAFCDVTSPASVAHAFAATRPSAAILCAALADIDRCEKEPALARAVNIDGAANVARECARSGVRLMFTSSGAVFDGEAERYTESDATSPISVYGKSKAAAERVIRETLPSASIARFSLVLGASPHGGTNALLDKLRALLQKGDPVFAPADEYRNPIDAGTLAHWMLDLAYSDDASGVFHLGSSDAVSRYAMVRELASAMGYSPDLVLAAGKPPPDRAPRGRCHMLVPGRILQYSSIPVPTSREAIERCVHASV